MLMLLCLTDNFPQVHIVHFDSHNKIKQIRLYWDQGSLLKQLDVIGARGRNWPIRDGKDQARLISTTTKESAANGHAAAAPVSQPIQTSQPTTKPRAQSTNVTRDPHASLALFAPVEEHESSSPPKAIAPRATASAKPPPRDYHDLFVAQGSNSPSAKTNSPKKENESMRPPPPKVSSSRPPTRDLNELFGGGRDDDSPVGNGTNS